MSGLVNHANIFDSNKAPIVYGKKLNPEGNTIVVNNLGTNYDIHVMRTDKKDYVIVTSPLKPAIGSPVKLQDAEKIIESWQKGFEAQGIKPESQEPKFAKPKPDAG